MMFHILFLVWLLFVNAESEEFSQETIKFHTLTDERFKEVYIHLRAQEIQIKEQRETIRVLGDQIYNQNQRSQFETLQDELRTKEIESLKDIVNRQQKEITEIQNQLSIVTSRQIKFERNSMKLIDILSHQRNKHKEDRYNRKLHPLGSRVETTASNINFVTSDNSLKNDRGRRLLIGPQTTVSPTIRPTAFYAYFSYEENLNPHHTLVFDIVKTNYNAGYSPFTGVFTVPMSGVYGFTYTIRMACSRSNSVGSFHIIRNSEIEGSIFFTETGCEQGTRTTTVIIHADSGDKVFIRTSTTYPPDGRVLSDDNGRSSFAGWLIFSDQ